MEERKRQIRLTSGEPQDRFNITLPASVGKAIRQNATKENLSLSAYLGLIIEDYLEKQKETRPDEQ